MYDPVLYIAPSQLFLVIGCSRNTYSYVLDGYIIFHLISIGFKAEGLRRPNLTCDPVPLVTLVTNLKMLQKYFIPFFILFFFVS